MLKVILKALSEALVSVEMMVTESTVSSFPVLVSGFVLVDLLLWKRARERIDRPLVRLPAWTAESVVSVFEQS